MEIPKFIKGVAKYFTYASDSGETTPTTQADLQELMKNNNTILECLVDGLWQPDKEMQLGQIVRSPNMPANTVAKVTSVGVTGTTEPEWPETVEATVSDGSVTFTMVTNIINSYTKTEIDAKMEDKADLVEGKLPQDQMAGSVYIPKNSNLDSYLKTGNYYSPTDLEAATILNAPLKTAFFLHVDRATELNSNQIIIHYPFNGRVFVRLYYAGAWSEWSELGGANIGDIFYRPFLMPGYVKANGATVIRTDYPNLVAYANNNNLWTSNPDIEPWKFGVGDGNTTMILPNYLNRVLQGGDSPAVLAAGLPNITGQYYAVIGGGITVNGAFTGSWADSSGQTSGGGGYNRVHLVVDASKSNVIYGASNTVQPPAIVLIPQIKY